MSTNDQVRHPCIQCGEAGTVVIVGKEPEPSLFMIGECEACGFRQTKIDQVRLGPQIETQLEFQHELERSVRGRRLPWNRKKAVTGKELRRELERYQRKYDR